MKTSAAAVAIFSLSLSSFGGERGASQEFSRMVDNPVELRRFLYMMPKGGDLHNHLDGAIYAESYINWAAEDGKCIDLQALAIHNPPCDLDAGRSPVADVQNDGNVVNRIIDGFSIRNYERREVSGHNQFFSTFAKFIPAGSGREGDMLAEASTRAARQNTGYLELMQSWGMFKAQFLANNAEFFDPSQPIPELLENASITQLVEDTIRRLDAIENRWREVARCAQTDSSPGCNVTIRYLAQVIRTRPRAQVLAQTLLAVRLIAADDRYVGLNFVAPEDNPITLRDHQWQMEQIAAAAMFLPDTKRNITLHAGELAMGLVPPEYLGRHVRQAIEIAGARRIGHGVDIVHDPDYPGLMARMANSAIAVEINLSSNDVILGIAGAEHPFETYRRHGVPMTLSTDDEGVSRIDLTHEYQRAVETYGLSYDEIKQISRNALTYSFLPGDSLYAADGSARFVPACRTITPGVGAPEGECAAFLANNDKARLQWGLEARFNTFESRFE